MHSPPPGGTLPWAFWFLGEIMFAWIPGAVVSIAGTGVPAPGGAPAPGGPITSPVTPVQIADYFQGASAPGAYDAFFREWSSFVALSLLASVCLGTLIIYSAVRVFQIRQTERRRFDASQRTVAAHDMPQTQLRWQKILDEANSDSEQAWRLAILEADIMLGELLDTLGYKGETMADKMRAVDRADFNTIDRAWEAHRARNRIAHEGDAHILGAREARGVIALYESVFREFKFIP